MVNEKTACCCCKLKSAATVVVVLSLLESFFKCITSIVYMKDLTLMNDINNYLYADPIITCILAILTSIVSCVAFFGIRQEKAIYILPWLVGYTNLCVYTLYLNIVQFMKYQNNEHDQAFAVGYLIGTVVGVIIVVYILNIVRRYYVHLKDQEFANNMVVV